MNTSREHNPSAGVHAVQGFISSGFESVASAFAGALTDPNSGAALAVRVDGQTVIDVWAGVADERDLRPWAASTPSIVFSCTKGLVSIVAAHLVTQGLLDYDARVTDYWPEFGAAGKANTRIRHLLAHRAGLSAPRVDLTFDDIVSWGPVIQTLQEQEPLWTPGAGWGYHALTHGWLVGEVVRRVTGQTIGDYFHDVIARPLAAEAWIGLPKSLVGTPAHLQVAQVPIENPDTPRLPSPTVGGPVSADFTDEQWMARAMTMGGALVEGVVADGVRDFNDPRVHTAQIPGAGGIATARALADIWSATIVETDGVRLLDDLVIADATVCQSEGPAVFSAEHPPHPRWGTGFMLNSERTHFLSPASFGHDGAGGQLGFADSRYRVGFGYITNRLVFSGDHRASAVVDTLREVLDD